MAPAAKELTATAVAAALPAGATMVGTLMIIAEISAEPTPVAGVDSSTWTPITAISALFFGADALHASFAPLPILFGLAVHLVMSLLVGGVGVGLILLSLGERAGPVGSMTLGVVYGLSVQVLALNIIVNGLETMNLVYESLPPWGWWVAHAAFGVTLGLATARALPLTMPRPQLAARSASAS